MAPGRQCKLHAPSPPLAAHGLLLVYVYDQCFIMQVSTILLTKNINSVHPNSHTLNFIKIGILFPYNKVGNSCPFWGGQGILACHIL